MLMEQSFFELNTFYFRYYFGVLLWPLLLVCILIYSRQACYGNLPEQHCGCATPMIGWNILLGMPHLSNKKIHTSCWPSEQAQHEEMIYI